MIDERSLSGACLAGEKYQTFPCFNSVGQLIQSVPHLRGQIEIGRVWIYVKGIFLQAEIAFVHGSPGTICDQRRWDERAVNRGASLSHTNGFRGSRDFPVVPNLAAKQGK